MYTRRRVGWTQGSLQRATPHTPRPQRHTTTTTHNNTNQPNNQPTHTQQKHSNTQQHHISFFFSFFPVCLFCLSFPFFVFLSSLFVLSVLCFLFLSLSFILCLFFCVPHCFQSCVFFLFMSLFILFVFPWFPNEKCHMCSPFSLLVVCAVLHALPFHLELHITRLIAVCYKNDLLIAFKMGLFRLRILQCITDFHVSTINFAKLVGLRVLGIMCQAKRFLFSWRIVSLRR